MNPALFGFHKLATIHVLTGRMGSGKSTTAGKLEDKYDLVLPTDFSRPMKKGGGGYVDPTKAEKERVREERRGQIFRAHEAGKRVLVEGHPPGVLKLFKDRLREVDKVYELPLSVEESFRRVLKRAVDDPKERDVMTDMDSAVSNNKKYDRDLQKIRAAGVPIEAFRGMTKLAAATLARPEVQAKVDQHLTPSTPNRWGGFGKNLRSREFLEAFRRDERVTPAQRRSAQLRHLHLTSREPGIPVPGSGREHTVKYHPEQQVYTCSCNDFTLRQSSSGGECKHIAQVKAQREYLQKKAGWILPALRVGMYGHQARRVGEKAQINRAVADAYSQAFPEQAYSAPLHRAAGHVRDVLHELPFRW